MARHGLSSEGAEFYAWCEADVACRAARFTASTPACAPALLEAPLRERRALHAERCAWLAD